MQSRIAGSLYMPVDQKTICGKNAMKIAAQRAADRSNSLRGDRIDHQHRDPSHQPVQQLHEQLVPAEKVVDGSHEVHPAVPADRRSTCRLS